MNCYKFLSFSDVKDALCPFPEQSLFFAHDLVVCCKFAPYKVQTSVRKLLRIFQNHYEKFKNFVFALFVLFSRLFPPTESVTIPSR